MSNATFTFGRFNPPTEEGHGKLVSAVQKHAEETGGKHYVFPTKSQDKKKNPMSHEDKVGAMRKLFPSANIVSHKGVHTAIDAMKHLESKGHTNVTMVVGSDRVDEFHGLLSKYRKKEFPGIKKVNVVSAGNRDPDAEGAEGMSASKLRGLVSSGKKKEFVSHYSDPKLGAEIHDKVKKGMQMESATPIGIFLLGGPGSGKDYVLNNIFSRFDLTEVQADQILAGSYINENKNIVINGVVDADKIEIIKNLLEGYDFDYVHVSVSNKISRIRNSMRANPLPENKRIEKWLKAEKLAESYDCFNFNNSINLNESAEMEQIIFAGQIEKLLERITARGLSLVEKEFPAVKRDKESGLPKKYVAGLSKSTAKARAAHWKEKAKLSDSDPRAYEPAPGDATAETKPSKYTKKYHAMYGEEVKVGDTVKYKYTLAGNKNKVRSGKVVHVGKNFLNVQQELPFKNKMHHTINPSDVVNEEMELEEGKYASTIAAIASSAYEPKIGDNVRTRKGGQIPGKVEKIEGNKVYFRHPEGKLYTTHSGNLMREEAELDEGAADTSLAAKAKKSGVSLSTLKKVYRRGVAAWNSGHRPGTTPSQWGHARVNSYITKGKTYHTADKDLREEVEDIDKKFEAAIEENLNCCEESAGIKSFSEFKEAVETQQTADVTPELKVSKRKGKTVPATDYRSSLAGLPVTTAKMNEETVSLEEAVQFHIENKVSFLSLIHI